MAKYNSHTGKWENVPDSRWGEHVFHRENFTAREPSLGWDGKFHDQEMPPGTFVYMINLPVADGMEKIVSGDLMLLC